MKKWLLLLLVFTPVLIWSQEDTSGFQLVTDTASAESGLASGGDNTTLITNNVDTAFTQAREYAYDREYEKSERLLNFYIKQYPEYYDLRTFLARTKLWQKEYEAAENILYGVLRDNPEEINAHRILTLSQQYQGNHDSAISLANRGLKISPNDPALNMHKAQSETATRQYKEALNSTNKVLDTTDDNDEAQSLKTFLLNQLINDGIAAGFGIDFIDENFARGSQIWYSGFAQLGTFTKSGILLGRINWAQRNNTSGFQGEIDFYPILKKRNYLYLNAGYSQSELFPEVQLGAEYYQQMFSNLEGSIGIRYLFFGEQTALNNEGLPEPINNAYNVILTSSLGWYFGENYLQGRVNFQFQNSTQFWSTSFQGLYRRFLGGSANFLQLKAQVGFIPDERLIQFNQNLGLLRYQRSLQSLGIAYQQFLDDNWYTRLSFTVTNQENRRDPETNESSFYRIYSPFVVLGYRF